jgi:hypothetical protein
VQQGKVNPCPRPHIQREIERAPAQAAMKQQITNHQSNATEKKQKKRGGGGLKNKKKESICVTYG